MESNDPVWQRVKDLLVTDFEVAPEQVLPAARTREDLGLDSLDHVDLVVELERFVGRRIETESLRKLKTVGDVVALLRGNLEGNGSAR